MTPPDAQPIRTLEEAAAYLEGLINVERRPDFAYRRLGLQAISALLARLGDPHASLRPIHIAGSKGKGSTALLCDALCGAAGLRAGTFTSPHLQSWTERFRIDGQNVAPARLAAAVARLRPEVEALRNAGESPAPTFFDATTAAALLLFQEAGLDVTILEVGLGGRLDSTNIVQPAVTCVTSIELEHTDKLGDDLAAIAAEKAGILKPGVPVVVGPLPEKALAVVLARARELEAPVTRFGEELSARVVERGPGGMRMQLRDGDLDLNVETRLHGRHQADNACLALACVRRTGLLGDAQLRAAAVRALSEVVLPGRLEFLSSRPVVVVDAAHTEASAAALQGAIRDLPRRRATCVLSISAGKAVDRILGLLLPEFDRVIATCAEPLRSLPADVLAEQVRRCAPKLELSVVEDAEAAVRAARASLRDDDLLCATGSVYLAGIAARAWRKPEAPGPTRH